MLFETKTPESGDHREADLTLSQLILRRPSALAVLHRHGMDTCCGGGLTVAEACRRHGVKVEDLWEALERPGG